MTDDAFGRGLSKSVFTKMGLGDNGTLNLAEMAGSGAMHAANLFHTDVVLKKCADQTTDDHLFQALVHDADRSPYIDVQ